MLNSVQKSLMATMAFITLGVASAPSFADITPTTATPTTATSAPATTTPTPTASPVALKTAPTKAEKVVKARTSRVKEVRKAKRQATHAKRLHATAKLDRKTARAMHKKLSESKASATKGTVVKK